jgi:hypothetical protein
VDVGLVGRAAAVLSSMKDFEDRSQDFTAASTMDGYFGRGYEGGRWDRDRFHYNRAVNNVNVTEIHKVYNTTVVNNYNTPQVNYNGGKGGVNERSTSQEEAALRERHIRPVAAQTQHIQAARPNQEMRASVERGRLGSCAIGGLP